MQSTTKTTFEERLMREIILIPSIGVLALVQVTLLPRPLGFAPMLMLVLVVCRVLIGVRSLHSDSSAITGMRWAFYGGIALDLYTTSPLGSHAIALLLAALIALVLASKLHVGGPLLPLIAVLIGGTVYEGVLAGIYAMTVTSFDWQRYAMVIILPSVLLALIPTLPAFFVMNWLIRDTRTPSGDAREGVHL